MALADFLARLYRPNDLADTLHGLSRRVASLEDIQLRRELEWTETRDKLLRYLKRLQELDRRQGGTEVGPSWKESRQRLMAAKFPKREGSG